MVSKLRAGIRQEPARADTAEDAAMRMAAFAFLAEPDLLGAGLILLSAKNCEPAMPGERQAAPVAGARVRPGRVSTPESVSPTTP